MAHTEITIGDLARETGCKAETIRYYERIGILPKPPRTAGNYRAYGKEHVARLHFVRRARDLGFSLDEAKELLELSSHEDQDCTAADRIARNHLDDVTKKISDLKRLEKELRHLIGQCQGGSISDCRIIEALAPKPA
jgi:Cu(I)-responsive transcriptional regulator